MSACLKLSRDEIINLLRLSRNLDIIHKEEVRSPSTTVEAGVVVVDHQSPGSRSKCNGQPQNSRAQQVRHSIRSTCTCIKQAYIAQWSRTARPQGGMPLHPAAEEKKSQVAICNNTEVCSLRSVHMYVCTCICTPYMYTLHVHVTRAGHSVLARLNTPNRKEASASALGVVGVFLLEARLSNALDPSLLPALATGQHPLWGERGFPLQATPRRSFLVILHNALLASHLCFLFLPVPASCLLFSLAVLSVLISSPP